MKELLQSHQRTVPVTRHNNGIVHSDPDTTQMELRRFSRGMAVTIPRRRFKGTDGVLVDVRPSTLSNGYFGSSIEAVRLVPLIKRPLQPVFYTAAGGGRVGGGGTSRKALHRAIQKEKHTRRK